MRSVDPSVLDRPRVEQLLELLDARLHARGVRASIYIVGGVAIAMSVTDSRRTADLDALVSDVSVLEEARSLALDEGLPPNWLNENAGPWIPPRAPEATQPPESPGLTVRVAPARHLLAMKLAASRRQDVDDIVALVRHLEMSDAVALDYATLLAEVYGSPDVLAVVLGVPVAAVGAEALAIGRWVAAYVHQKLG